MDLEQHAERYMSSSISLQSSSSWIEIDAAALHHNVSQLKRHIGSKKISAVVKANAYGHGLLEVAALAERHQDIDSFSVFSLREAIVLRKSGIKKPILVLGAIDLPIKEALVHNVTLSLHDATMARDIQLEASCLGVKARVHIKIDTGLSRLGFMPDAIQEIVQVTAMSHIIVEGIYSHFSESDLENDTFTRNQAQQFCIVLQQLKERGITIPIRHIQNTSAAIRFAADPLFADFTMVRIGGGMLGLLKPYIKTIIPADLQLRQIFSWKSRFIQLKKIPAKSFVSYARTYQVHQESLIGIIPIGYSDGFDRRFSNNGYVIIKGKKAPIIGRICMNVMIVDVSAIQYVTTQDDILIMGSQQDSSADTLADKISTINYELLTRINKDIPRIIV